MMIGNNDRKIGFDNRKVIFRRYRREDFNSLVNMRGVTFSKEILNPSLQNRFFNAIGLKQQKKGLIAYAEEENRIIGYLELIKNTASLYSIQNIFVDSRFRGRGIATGLLSYAFSCAKENGGKKVFLTGGYPHGNEAELLYEKMGFRTIVTTSMAYVGNFGKFPLESEDHLIPLDIHSNRDRRKIFSVYKSLMGEKWVSFFENSSGNIVKGFSQDFQRFSFKVVFINEFENSFAIVSSYFPLLSMASVELYSASDELIPSMLQELFRILHNRGITYAKTTLFNIKDREFAAKDPYLLNQMDYALQMMFMGRLL
jgi:GNAT superfamily N-acetyltransferase